MTCLPPVIRLLLIMMSVWHKTIFSNSKVLIKSKIKVPRHVELRDQYLWYKVQLQLKVKENTKTTPTMSGLQWYSTTCTTNKQWWRFHSTMMSTSTVPKSSKDNSNTRLASTFNIKNSIWTPTAPFSRASRKKLATLTSNLPLSALYICTISTMTVISQCSLATRLFP